MYVITGASSGLGLELAKLLVAQGEEVVSLSRTAPGIDGVGHIECDLTHEGSINAAAAVLLKEKAPITALVNCAGVYSQEEIEEISGKTLAPMFTTNIIGPEILVALLFDRIVKDESDIMNVASIMATRGDDYAPGYTTSKWALRGFSEVLRARFKGMPNRVVSFCPGGMNTEIFKKAGLSHDSSSYMDPAAIAELMLTILRLPKNVEVSEIIIAGK